LITQPNKLKFPFLQDIKVYTFPTAAKDLLAGITVAVMLIPQGMAYAMLAGLPPIYGLYAGLIPMILYPLLGTSKQLSVGPVAMVSILVLAGLSPFAEPFSEDYIQLAILTAILSGLLQIVFAVFRLGFMVKFLSDPVLTGFAASAAIIIAIGQLPNILGIEALKSGSTVDLLESIFWNLKFTHWLTFLIGGGALFILLLLKKINRRFPTALFLLLIGVPTVYYFELYEQGVSIIGEVPSGLPSFEMPNFSLKDIEQIFPLAIIICLLSFIESLAIAKTIATKNDDPPIEADKELLALGIAKVVGGFFQSYPTTGSFSRSAVNNDAGAKTGMASIFGAIIIGFSLLFLTPYIYYLPKAILAAIVLSAIVGLIDIPKAKFYYKTSRHDFWVMMLTFFGTLILGIQNGVLLGILLSVGYIIYRSSSPTYAVLGHLITGNGVVFRNIERFQKAKERDDLLIIRFDAPIYFANADYFSEIIWTEIYKRKEVPLFLQLDFSSVNSVDATGLQMLEQLVDKLNEEQIVLILTNLHGPIRDRLNFAHLLDKIGHENIFLINKDAYTFTENPHERNKVKMKIAVQSKKKR